jgi:dTDP-4-dehydrorhamnose reductase
MNIEMSQQKYLVIGWDSQLGSALAHYLKGVGEKVYTTTRRLQQLSDLNLHLDLSGDVSQWKPPEDINIAFLFAAVTSVEKCRTDPEVTRKINVENTIVVAKKLIEKGALIVFPSTNLVFNGDAPYIKADCQISPCVEYGRQKAEVERRILELGTDIVIVRLTKVIGSKMTIFKDWYENLQKNQVIHPFSDMVMSPISLDFTIKAIDNLSRQRRSGIWQISGEEDVSYEQIARHIAKKNGFSEKYVQPIKTDESGLIFEHVPKHTTLDISKLKNEMGICPPGVWETIDTFLGYK